MDFIKERNRIVVMTCIEIALMRRGYANYNLVQTILDSFYNCNFGDCMENLDCLKIVLNEVYENDYTSVLEDITWELEMIRIRELNDFKDKFCKIMAS